MLQESQISDLINQSGRLRMLSHRAAMMLSYMSGGDEDPWFAEELESSICAFEDSFEQIQQALKTEATIELQFRKVLAKSDAQTASIEESVSRYLRQIRSYQKQVRAKSFAEGGELSQFCKFVATDLLTSLNAIVSFFDDMLNQVSEEKHRNIGQLAKSIEDSIDEVDQINLSIKILSFNASVEAARAGEAGRGFKVVSQEMNNLSSNTRNVTKDIKKTVMSFLEQL